LTYTTLFSFCFFIEYEYQASPKKAFVKGCLHHRTFLHKSLMQLDLIDCIIVVEERR